MSLTRVGLVLMGILLLATSAVAHGNYVAADAQVSADGTIRIEFAVLVTDGFIVLHADNDGQPGIPIGHGSFAGYIASDFSIQIEPSYWANQTGPGTIWAVLHQDTGDGRFSPLDDPPIRTAEDDELVASKLLVRPSTTGPVNVAAERDHPQETNRSVVVIRTVRLNAEGYVVVRADAESGPGAVIGHRALPAGEHHNVTVSINETFYERRPERFSLWAVVHRSDGDARFDASSDAAVSVGETPVMTRFSVIRTDPIERTETATPIRSDESPTTTESGHHDEDHSDHTHAHTEESARTTESASTEGHSEHEHDTAMPSDSGRATTTTGQPGFGVSTATISVLIVAVFLRRRSD